MTSIFIQILSLGDRLSLCQTGSGDVTLGYLTAMTCSLVESPVSTIRRNCTGDVSAKLLSEIRKLNEP